MCSQGGPVGSHVFFANNGHIFCIALIANFRDVKRLLGCYATTPSQKNNMEKLTVAFSLNVHHDLRLDILNYLGMVSRTSHDKYLGLPTLIGPNK